MTVKKENDDLARKLGLFPVTNIIIANMIGAGIFTTSGLLLKSLDHALLMIVLWFAGGIIALFGAFCYGELGAAFPRAGGEYIYLSRLYNPLMGFLSGWVSFIVGFSAPIAASSIGCSEYLIRIIPQIQSFALLDQLIIKKTISVSIIIMFTFIHVRRLEFGTGIQNLLTVLKVALIIALILVGFSLGQGNIGNIFHANQFVLSFDGWKTIGLSLMWIMFAYSGWNAATYIGSEIKKPERNLPFSLIIGTGIVIILYIFLNILYVYAIPPEKMKGVISIGGLAGSYLFGKAMENIFSLLIAFALFSSISAFIILGPRVYYAMAKNGYFFKFAANVNFKTGIPSKSIILQCLLSIIMVVSGTFEQILTYMGFSLGIFPVFTVLGIFKLRKIRQSKYLLPGYPIVPVIYLFATISILILAFLERPAESIIAILTVIVGIPLYYIFKKQREKK